MFSALLFTFGLHLPSNGSPVLTIVPPVLEFCSPSLSLVGGETPDDGRVARNVGSQKFYKTVYRFLDAFLMNLIISRFFCLSDERLDDFSRPCARWVYGVEFCHHYF